MKWISVLLGSGPQARMLTPAPSHSLAPDGVPWPKETGAFEHKVIFLGLFGGGFVERKSYDLSEI